MEHTGLPHDHGEEQNHTAAMQELLRDGAHFQNIADIFRQLGDPNRIRIFWLLCHCEECVVNIAAMVDMSSPAPVNAALKLFGELVDELEKLG